jgi:hypothetical protein
MGRDDVSLRFVAMSHMVKPCRETYEVTGE